MVITGLEILLSEHIHELSNLSVGVLANNASVTNNLMHISDALNSAGVKISALFGPEHGARGNALDGETVEDTIDERLGIPIYSLYGKTQFPSKSTLENIDLIIIDVQDIGARFYTFAQTMANVMSVCGKQNIPVWVLDRPNPITGSMIEGAILEKEFASFVGMYPIPVRHGLTIGELAKVFLSLSDFDCNLRVIRMRNWSRDMWFDNTQLPWIMPSPNMPTINTAIVYPGTCLLEGTNVSEGRGTTWPFEMFGAPWIDPQELWECLLNYDLPGVIFSEAYFIPYSSKYCGKSCSGLQIHVQNRLEFRPVLTGIAIISTIKQLYPNLFEFRKPGLDGFMLFDRLIGNSRVRCAIESDESPLVISASGNRELSNYKKSVEPSFLYE